MAGEALCRDFCGHHSIRLAVAFELLKTPASGRRISFALLYHYIDAPSRPFRRYSLTFSCFEKVSDNNRTVGKPTGSIPLHGFFIGIDVMDSSGIFKKWARWTDQRTHHMHPLTVARRIWYQVIGISP